MGCAPASVLMGLGPTLRLGALGQVIYAPVSVLMGLGGLAAELSEMSHVCLMHSDAKGADHLLGKPHGWRHVPVNCSGDGFDCVADVHLV